jgi:hypothetical protein
LLASFEERRDGRGWVDMEAMESYKVVIRVSERLLDGLAMI